MRLVCPNCGATYEVDDRVIPEGGRDVQCSNCGHGWFQRHADGPRDEIEEVPVRAVTAEAASEETTPEDADEVEAPGAEPERMRRPLDENVRGILAEEAEREMQARAREGEPVETQGDLGIDDYTDPEADRRRRAREQMTKAPSFDSDESFDPDLAPTPADPASRRELFPDIEEINSTLDGPRADRAPVDYAIDDDIAEEREAPRGGFRRGFSFVVIVVGVAFGVYLLAPQIVELFPGLTDEMVIYVDAVNRLFAEVEALMQTAIERIEEAAGDGQ